MILLLVVIVVWLAFNFGCYVCLTPDIAARPRTVHPMERHIGTFVCDAAYGLSLLRLPFTIVPYMVKLALFFLFHAQYSVNRYVTLIEGFRIIGDIANFALTTSLMIRLGLPPWFITLTSGAEFIRLMAEKGQMIVSAIWQQIPHRRIAQQLISRISAMGWLRRYCTYYLLNDEDRLKYVLQVLKQSIGGSGEATAKLAYVNGFRIVPDNIGLRAGAVRDVARGEIFVHRCWSNDPWLLAGQAMRRAPWMFDPRFLTRPFYYRSQSNRLATLFVLHHARCCLPYAIYQLGHEIKAARYDLFYRLARRLGCDIEAKVSVDGTAQFDPFIQWLGLRLGSITADNTMCELWSDENALADIQRRIHDGERFSPEQVAADYSYPMKYVEEVMWDKVLSLMN